MRFGCNNILRRLIRVPSWHSARTLFVHNHVRRFSENIRAISSYSRMWRVFSCINNIMQTVLHSDCYTLSSQWLLYPVITKAEMVSESVIWLLMRCIIHSNSTHNCSFSTLHRSVTIVLFYTLHKSVNNVLLCTYVV